MTINPVETMRVMHHIAIGVNEEQVDHSTVDQAYAYLKEVIARHSGGLTSFKSDGVWFPEYELGNLSGDVEHNVTFNFIVTLSMEEELYGVWDQIKISIADGVKKYDLGCEHIHCTAWWSQARHFRTDTVALSNDNCPDSKPNTSADNDDDSAKDVA